MATHYKRLLVGIAFGIAVGITVGAVAIGSSAINGRTSDAVSETTDKVRIVDDRKLPGQWAINAAYGRGALNNLQAAPTDIAGDNADEARKGVTVAQSLLIKIKSESLRTVIDPLRPAEAANFILVHSEVRVLDGANPASVLRAS